MRNYICTSCKHEWQSEIVDNCCYKCGSLYYIWTNWSQFIVLETKIHEE